jgi:hypothetical protein
LCRDGSRNLGNFDGVGEPVPEMIRIAPGENLRLRLQTAKGARMDHPVAVALEVIPVGMGRLGMSPSARFFHADSVVGEHEKSLAAFEAASFEFVP